MRLQADCDEKGANCHLSYSPYLCDQFPLYSVLIKLKLYSSFILVTFFSLSNRPLHLLKHTLLILLLANLICALTETVFPSAQL